jgi:hypothetical protein
MLLFDGIGCASDWRFYFDKRIKNNSTELFVENWRYEIIAAKFPHVLYSNQASLHETFETPVTTIIIQPQPPNLAT